MKYDVEIQVSRPGEGSVKVAVQLEPEAALKNELVAAVIRLFDLGVTGEEPSREEKHT